MTLEYACIAPHGAELIPRLASRRNIEIFRKTREGIRRIARDIVNAKPDAIVIASPHNLRLVGKICIVVSENSTGELHSSPKKSVTLKAKCDVKLARELLQTCLEDKLPVVGANYGTFTGHTSDLPMDWGTLVPLWFVLREKRARAKIVIVTPSREIPLSQNITFGRVLAKLLEKKRGRRVVFIASADQAHVHRKSGPYGFSKAADRFDKIIVEAVKRNNLDVLTRLDRRFVEQAKPDSPWQMAILAGITETVRMKSELYTYEAPTYYGMICAAFHRTGIA